MNIDKDYSVFTSVDFAGDESFQEWVLRPEPNTEDFWKKFITEHPDLEKEIQQAIALVRSIHFKEEWPSAGQESRSLKKALTHINSGKKVSSRVVRFERWWAAAAVLVIMAAGGYFLLKNKAQPDQPILVHNIKKNDIAPGGNKAVLTLADGSAIVLDSAQNGMLSQQGGSKVMKLDDGKIAYDQSGNQQSAIRYNTISTPRGGQYQLTLADGSKVWLNAASSITFPTSFAGDKREVKITGEAYFEVAHNAKVPFIVKNDAKNVRIEVLGTHFNVNTYDDQSSAKVTLLVGSVKVSRTGTFDSRIIRPGEQAQISSGIEVVKDVDMENVMAWKNGYFKLDGTSLKSLMSEISRWYDVDISYKGNIPDKKFGGSISRNVNLSTVLEALKISGINSSLDGKKLTLSEGIAE